MIGAGAIGGTIGAAFADSGTEVVLVARGDNARAIESAGLRLRSPDRTITAHPTVVREPGEVVLGTHDVLILATKTHQALSALRDWADQPVRDATGAVVGTAGERLPLLLFLNGVEAQRIAPRWFARVWSTTIWLPALHTEPGEVVVRMHPALGGFFTGPVTAAARTDTVLDDIAADFRAAGFEFVPVEDIAEHAWAKLLSNLANGLDAILGPGADLTALAREMRTEAKAVYRAAGIEYLSNGPARYGIAERLQMGEVPGVEAFGSSSWQSLARGTGSIETDYLTGEIVRLAHVTGTAAPRCALVSRWCRALAAGSDLGGEIPAGQAARQAALEAAFARFAEDEGQDGDTGGESGGDSNGAAPRA